MNGSYAFRSVASILFYSMLTTTTEKEVTETAMILAVFTF